MKYLQVIFCVKTKPRNVRELKSSTSQADKSDLQLRYLGQTCFKHLSQALFQECVYIK